jgi:hypothetical protein
MAAAEHCRHISRTRVSSVGARSPRDDEANEVRDSVQEEQRGERVAHD